MSEKNIWLKYYGIRFNLTILLSSFLTTYFVTYLLNLVGKYPDTGNFWIVFIIVLSYYLFNLVLRYAKLNQIIYFLLIRSVVIPLVILIFAK